MSPHKNIAGPQIEAFRTEKGLSLKDLATAIEPLNEAVTLSELDIEKIETQQRSLSDLELITIAKALEIPGDCLFYPKDEVPRWLKGKYRCP